MKPLIVFVLFVSTLQIRAQKVIEKYYPQNDTLRIGKGEKDILPYSEKGYTLILPSTSADVSGVLISLEDRKFEIQKNPRQQIYPEAIAKNFAVLYVSTGIPLDLYFSSNSLHYIDNLILDVFKSHNLSNKNIFFLGVNLAGHRALKYIESCKLKQSKFDPDVKGIILCEGVLDWVRQWYEATKGVRDNFDESSVFEGNLITYLLEKNLGGTPNTSLEKFLDFSSYSYFDETNRHIKYFDHYAIRAYTEPASYYWVDVKRKTTFDTNFPDMIGIINELKLAGNTNSEFIIFNQDIKNKDRRNPNYTWGLVDKKELMEWISVHAN